MKLGSLFDGAGGFPFAAQICGIEPVWASEIEPFPVAVTTKRFPDMKHLGDVTKVNGADIEPVDIITFGSPCQDLSVAGKRAGLEGERSGLFMEAIRIIKEMRDATANEFPRFGVWENVPGAFSSAKGEDFRAVLEAFCQVKDGNAVIPRPPKGKWADAGEIVGDGYSVAWRVLDAQFWGVPSRRRRIFLVADFRGERAGEILFKREGLRRNFAESRASWQGAAGTAEEGAHPAGVGTDGYNGAIAEVAATLGVNCGMSTGRNGVMVLNDQGGSFMAVSEDVTGTLRSQMDGHPPVVLDAPDAIAVENHPTDSRLTVSEDGKVQTLTSRMGTGGNNVPLVMKIRCGCEGGGKGPLIQTDKSATLATNNDQTLFVPAVFGICAKDSNAMKSDNPNSGFYKADTTRTLDANGGNPSCNQGGMAVVALEGNGARPSHQGRGYSEEDVSFTLNATEQHGVAYGIDRAAYNQGQGAKFNPCIESELEPPMVARGPGAVAHPVYSTSKNSYHTTAEEDIVNTLVATDYKDLPTVTEEPYYIVRRLTPTECARLQGFPDWWCADLGTEEPSEADVAFWREVFETHRAVTSSASKPKTDAQIVKWLKDPHADSAEYKLWGNGVALPCVLYVMEGIKEALEKDE